jgi:hypothetical protein
VYETYGNCSYYHYRDGSFKIYCTLLLELPVIFSNVNSSLKWQGHDIWFFVIQEVFDKDMLSADDSMGDAWIDLQPLVSAARVQEGVKGRERLQIGKWLATNDNALVADSIIWQKGDGKVMQELSLQLQHVESGTLQLELEWSPVSGYEEQGSFNSNILTPSSSSKRSDQSFKSTSIGSWFNPSFRNSSSEKSKVSFRQICNSIDVH